MGFFGDIIKNVFNKNDLNKGISKSAAQERNTKENKFTETADTGLKRKDLMHTKNSQFIRQNTAYANQNDYDITGYIPNDGVLAVVNNRNNGGTWQSKFGYLESHADGLKDGTVIRVYNDGTYSLLDDENASEDFKAQYNSFKEGYDKAKKEYDKAIRFQNLANRGYDVVSYGTENETNHADSFLELFNNMFKANKKLEEAEKPKVLSFTEWKKQQGKQLDGMDSKQQKTMYNVYKASNEETLLEKLAPEKILGTGWEAAVAAGANFLNALKDEKFTASVKDYMYTKSWYQAIVDHKDSTKAYVELYKKDPDKARDLLMEDTNLSDRERAYIAYTLVQGKEDKKLGDYLLGFGLNSLYDIGETMDWLANPVKGAAGYIDNKDGYNWTGITNTSDTLKDTIAAAYRTSWDNEGRQAYNYDTGFIPFDFALEILSDPESIVAMASKGLQKGIASGFESVLPKGTKGVSDIIKQSKNADELVTNLKVAFPDSAEALTTMARNMHEYEHAIKLDYALNGALNMKNGADKFLALGATNGVPLALKATMPIVARGNRWVIDKVQDFELMILEHRMAAAADALGKVGEDLTLNTVAHFIDETNLNLTVMRKLLGENGKDASALKLLSKDEKLRLVAQAYNNSITDSLATMRQSVKKDKALLRYSLGNVENADNPIEAMLIEYGVAHEGDLKLQSILDQYQRTNFFDATDEERHQFFMNIMNSEARRGEEAVVRHLVRKDAVKTLRMLGLDDADLYTVCQTIVDSGTHYFKPADAPGFTKEAYDYISGLNKDSVVKEIKRGIDSDVLNNSFKKMDTDSIIDKGTSKVYVLKPKEDIVADIIQRNGYYRAAVESFQILGENESVYSQVLMSADPVVAKSGVRDVMHDMLASSAAVHNYYFLKDRIKESACIPDNLKDLFVDKLFSDSFDNYCKNSFRGTDARFIDNTRIDNRSRTIANRLIDEVQSLDAARARLDTFEYLKCNTKDLKQNVENIQKLVDDMPDKDDFTFYVPYSMDFTPDGDLYKVVVKDGDDVREFTLLTEQFERDDDALTEFEQYMLGVRSGTTHAGMRIQLVGFNNHVYGLQTDAMANAWFYRNYSQVGNIIRGSLDLADDMRLEKYGIVPLPESAHQELIEMFKESLNNWRGDRELKKITLMDRDVPFSVKPPTYNQLNDWILRTSDYEEVDIRGGFNGVAKSMHDSLVDTARELQYAEQGLTRNLGYIKTTADTKYFDVVKELPKELGAKKIYDAEIVKNWFDLDTDNIPFSKMREWYDIANNMQKTFNSIKDPGWCQTFAKDINYAYKKMIKVHYDYPPKWFHGSTEDWYAMYFKFDKERNLSRKVAILKYFYDNASKEEKLMHWDFKLVTALADPSKTFARNGKFYNPYQRISGSVENPFSKWNIETSMNATIKQMDSLLSNIELYDSVRQAHPELLGELAVAQIEHDNEMRKFYNEIVGYLKKARDTGGYAGTIKMKSPVSGKEGEYVIAFGDKHMKKYIQNLNPYEKYWYKGVHQPSTLEYINKGIQEAEVWAHDGQLRAVSSMTNDEFLSHLVHDTQGICPNALASFNAADKKNFLQFFNRIKADPRFETYVDETREVYTIFVRNIDELRETTPVINFNYNIFKHAQTSGHDMSQNARSMMYLYNKAAEFNDPSYTFFSMQHQDDTYFYTLRDMFLPHEADLKPPKVRSASAYDCGYIGNIKELMGNPEVKSFVSGNMFTNFLNSYARTIVDNRNIETLAPVMFKKNIYKDMDTDAFKKQMDDLDIFGYRILARDKFGYIKDITNYTAKEIKSFDDVAILRADEAQKAIVDMRNTITDPRPWMQVIKAIRKFESENYLKWMLNSTPFPGLNNWKDSTIKAILSEGVGILPYYKYSVDLINKSRKPLVDLYKMLEDGKIDTLTEDVIRNIAKKKWDYDISVDDLVKVFKFKNSTVSSIDSGQHVLLETLKDVAKPILKDEDGNILRDEAGKALRGHNEWFGFNEWLFSSPEVVNRLAIYLKAMDETGNVAKAYERIKLSQFEYSKNTIQTYLDTAKPFSTFQLYNIKFWLSDLWFQEGGARRAGHLADIYNSSYDVDEAAERYWSDDMMELRALIDTCNFEEEQYNYVQHYDKFKDFVGSPMDTAKSNGWIKFSDSDTLWFKAGVSWLDAYTGVNSFSFGLGDNLWSPFKICIDVTNAIMSGEYKLITDFENSLRTTHREYKEDDAKYLTGSEFWSRHGYDLISLMPVISTAYYFLESFARNELYAARADKGLLYRLGAALPGMFAPAKEYPAGSREQRWYERPVGFDWYNQSDEYKATHRYIPGVSYVPAWVSKDPATYINTLGRLQQILGGTDGAYEFMQLGEGFWFTKDGDTYKLHNYKLMIGDEQTRAALKDSLINKFGWSADAADYLLDQWGEPMWKKKYSSHQAKESSYYLGGSRSYNNTATLIGKTKNSIPHSVVRRYGANLKPTQAPVPKGVARPKFNNNPLGVRVSTGKNVKYSDSTLHRMSKGVDPEKASRQYQIERRWHYRRRDIYKDNYAKYGASRMAMEQNLKNYSNRSITEMRRTNQNIRYSQIHRHSEW